MVTMDETGNDDDTNVDNKAPTDSKADKAGGDSDGAFGV